jgi:hypothetical protein
LSILKQWWQQWSNDPVIQRNSLELGNANTPFTSFLPPWGPLDDEGVEVLEEEEVGFSKPSIL